ncbi:MAG: hypothetical protein RL205_490 [Actinomycetota bacterium]
MKRRAVDDTGSVMLLGIVLVAVCVLALAVVVDVSSLFIQRRNLAAIADAAALAGAQAIDLDQYYAHGASKATALDPATVARVVRAHVTAIAASDGMRGMRLVGVESDGESVSVHLSAPVQVPFLSSLVGERAEVIANARLDYRPVREA